MIPTVHKDALPKGHSYPIGAQRLSELLEAARQYNELTVSFHRAEHPAGKPLRVLVADYFQMERGMSASRYSEEHGCYGPNWDLTAYSVPSEQRHLVNQLLQTKGINRLLRWLGTPRTETWAIGRHACEVWFDPATRALCYEERDT
jgi:hypothetical protein